MPKQPYRWVMKAVGQPMEREALKPFPPGIDKCDIGTNEICRGD